jgi:hypothetical protein
MKIPWVNRCGRRSDGGLAEGGGGENSREIDIPAVGMGRDGRIDAVPVDVVKVLVGWHE